jgi:predicted helicase
MNIDQYIATINQRYKLGNATEHTFRGDLQQLIESLVPGIRATNEPKRQSCGAPDYILTKKDIPVGFIEAKDIGDGDLEGAKKAGNKEQFDRYKASLNNLIFTDYLHFYLYRDGQLVLKIAIAELTPKGIKPLPENFQAFENLLKDFCTHIGQTIKSSKRLAEMMAGKARLLSEVIEKALTSDESNHEDSTLKEQMLAFRQILIHDITPKGFADVYAQTIAYGMFAARLHDPTLPTFSRQEAAELIPKSNPFLRKLFGYIAGPDIDDRIKWIVDSLVEIFLACNVEEILKNYGKATKMENPIIHFYETFLSEYDAALRKARGVWYTPHPVVNFQVRAIDEILKTEFNLPQGIADSSKIKIKVNVQGKMVEQEVHRVQMLDPATGTGTYIAEVITLIYQKFKGQEGIWSNYVENHLLPRLIGFELLMASYAMAHLQIDLLLKETGYQPTREQRLKIFLTNSLEESHPDTGTLFANWLSAEANEANRIKRDSPVMVVMGNPPYSVSSSNKSEWIEKLTVDYKRDLNERNIQPLSDDYIKFIRFGQYYIDKNGSGVLAFISNNSFIDGIIHRQMRKNLLESFDKIYILDLHGSAKKNETSRDGSKDENVFDIQQGVSINIFIKTSNKKSSALADIFHFDLYGSRELKYEILNLNTIKSLDWERLKYSSPNYFFTKKDFTEIDSYEKGFKIDVLFKHNACGIVTARDGLVIKQHINELSSVINDFNLLDEHSFRFKYNEKTDSRDWTYLNAKNDLENASIQRIDYRPFDKRFIIYSSKSKGILSYPRNEIMKHMLFHDNLGLLICKQQSTFDFQHVFITNTLSDKCSVSLQTKEATYHFPLYLYAETNGQQTLSQTAGRTPNLNMAIIEKFEKSLNHVFIPDENIVVDLAAGWDGTFYPLDVLDYIYAVLHSPTYREKYKEFLKIDFPRVPYPKDAATFWQLVALGGQIRQIHLLESPIVEQFITQYPIGGNNVVTKVRFEENYEIIDGEEVILLDPQYPMSRVYINDSQFFQMVPKKAWGFYIGGYQPAQKWLKDRKDRSLDFEDILHYQKIIVALTETDRLMKEIDRIKIE